MACLSALCWVGAMNMMQSAVPQESTVDVPVQGRENVSFAYADVLRATPTYELIRARIQSEECDSGEPPEAEAAAQSSDPGASLRGPRHGTVSELERERGRPPPRKCRLVESEREERRISGYEVEYFYKGQIYRSHMDYDPGNKLRIRLTVAPAD